MTLHISAEDKAFLSGIADDIEKHGHWQPRTAGVMSGDPCCVWTSPTYSNAASKSRQTERRLLDLLGFDVLDDVWEWNDTTPTAEVLTTLRQGQRI
jgi:hypothetical protein